MGVGAAGFDLRAKHLVFFYKAIAENWVLEGLRKGKFRDGIGIL
jgi:hypothetical protein